MSQKIPVILDTDIGYDIDDTWALAMLLRSPELDCKYILSDSRHTIYSSSIIAKFLEKACRTDIPVGVGIPYDTIMGDQKEWIDNYKLKNYPGDVYYDGVEKLIDIIKSSNEQITLICIGPVPNIAHAVKRAPEIVDKVRFVGMQGSIYKKKDDKIINEYNVKEHAKECRTVFSQNWDVTITPLDTCGSVILESDHYQKLQNSDDQLIQALLENYRVWLKARGKEINGKSSILFDTVAVYLAFTDELLNMEKIRIIVTDEGQTKIDETGKSINCAITWKDQNAFYDFLTKRLLGEV